MPASTRSSSALFAERAPFRLSAVLVATLALAACGDDGAPPLGRPCASDGECGSALACVEDVCANAWDDPGGDEEPPNGPVRVFAVGLHPVISDFETQDTFRASIAAVMDEHVVPSLPASGDSLVVFPEDTGLMAALIGERGTAARADTSITGAYLALGTSYGEAGDYYLSRATESIGPGRIVSLSVTDTLWRSLEHTFASLAREHGVWIAVTYNVADAERTTDPELVRIFADEGAADRSYAWVAEGDAVYNQTLVYDPTGALVHRWRKEYLVPIEESDLNLSYGDLGGLDAYAMPFGTVASVISKDAWMPDVLDRLALEGARLMLQPEAFSGWGVPHGEDGAWAPDVLKESGWAHVMRYPEFRANVLPCLSANVLNLFFDCQSAILGKGGASGAFIGQDPDVGFVAVAPWVVADDGVGTLEERRARLIEVGERLLPGSGAPEENMYVAGTVWADLDLGAPFATREDVVGFEVAPSDAGEQRRPDIAVFEDGTAIVVWEDTRRGRAQIYGARLDAAITPGEARVRVPTTGVVRQPRVAVRGDVAHLVYQQDRVVRYARSIDRGRSFPDPIPIAPLDGVSQWVPAIAASEDGNVHVAWVDDRDGAARVWYARSTNDGRQLEEARAIDDAPPSEYRTRHNQWAPSIAARGDVVAIAWTDFRAFRWEIWGAVSTDRGVTFGEATRLDDYTGPLETLSSDPQSLLLDDGSWLVAWTDLRERRPNYDVRVRRLDPRAIAGSAPSTAVPAPTTDARPEWRPAIAAWGSEVRVVYQALPTDHDDLYVARSDDGGESFVAVTRHSTIADDVERYAPRVVVGGDHLFYAAWETTGSGARRVRVSRVE